MQCMDRATTAAQRRITELSFLWGPKGLLRVAFESTGQETSSDFCNIVNRMVDDWERISLSTMKRREKTAKEARTILGELSQTQSDYTNVKEPSGPLTLEDKISGVLRDLNSIKQQIDEAYCRKMESLLVTVTSRFQLGELDSLFLPDTEEGPTNDDRKTRGATLKPTQTNRTQIQRDLLKSEISKANQEAEKAEADIKSRRIELQTVTGIAQGIVEGLKGVY
ncbi:unnamed protein product [Clonostachys solani]|uniref:Uncharacterized protein n=1 Tax=Clonostachys solani TaxID=160281 RepID=A0A9N9ZMN1_9HYPO|nr:unnamed protein product [Clonostachys solani]